MVIALLICALPAAIPAQATVPAAQVRVSLEQALAAAERAPEMVVARAAERAADAAVRVAGALADGSVSFSSYSVSAHASLSGAFPLPLERGARVGAARSGVVVAALSRAETLLQARRELRAAWFALASAEERARAVADRSERAARNLSAVQSMLEEGRVSRLDHVRASADAALARSESGAAQEQSAAAAARLGLLMGLGPGASVSTAGPAARPVAEPALDGYLDRVAQASPTLRVEQARLDQAVARLGLERRLRWPNLTLAGGANWNDPTQPGTDKWVGLDVSVPFGKGAAVAVARADREGEEAAVERERRLAMEAGESAWHAARAARLRFEAVDGEALPAAREAAELTSLAYREGRVDIFRVLDAERALAEATLLRADALEAWGAAYADLLEIEGEEAP